MRRIGFGLIMALGVASVSCNKSDPVDPTVPFKMVMLDGEPQSGTAGTDAEAPRRVQVQNSVGDGVSGVTVSWAVTSGAGVVSAASQETNSQGISSVTFTYGDPGEQIIRATVPGLTGSPQTFNLTAAAGGGGGGGGGEI